MSILMLTVARPAFVSAYYQLGGEWVPVDDWNVREEQGLPPIVVWATERENKVFTSTDVKCGSVYDHCGYLTGYGPDSCSFETLHAAAKALGYAGHGFYSREVLVHVSSTTNPQRPALQTFAGNSIFSIYSPSEFKMAVDRVKAKIDPHAEAVGDRSIVFEFDAKAE